jgi:Ca2+-binding RTX toxin-like protein
MANLVTGSELLSDGGVSKAELEDGYLNFTIRWTSHKKVSGSWVADNTHFYYVITGPDGFQFISGVVAAGSSYTSASGTTGYTDSSFAVLKAGYIDGDYTIQYFVSKTGAEDSFVADGSTAFVVDTVVSTNTLTNASATDADTHYIGAAKLLTGQTEAGAKQVVLTFKDASGLTTLATTTLTATNNSNSPIKADGTWSTTLPSNVSLNDGTTYSLIVTVTDAVGNTGTKTFTLKADTVAPAAPSVDDFAFIEQDSKWKHDIASLGVVGDISGGADAFADVNIFTGNMKNGVFTKSTQNFQVVTADEEGRWTWTPSLDLDDDGVADSDGIALDTLYQSIAFKLESVDQASNTSEFVHVLLGAHALQWGTNEFDEPTVVNDINDVLIGSAFDDMIIGYNGDDRLEGRAGDDWLYGGQGRDTLIGGEGNDVLVGGTQADILDGGAGADRFVFSKANESSLSEMDTIVNFSVAEGDQIDISALCASLGINGVFQANAWGANGSEVTTTKVKGKTITTVVSSSTVGDFWISADGILYGNLSGDSRAEFAVKLQFTDTAADLSVVLQGIRNAYTADSATDWFMA